MKRQKKMTSKYILEASHRAETSTVENFQLYRDQETLKRFTEFCARTVASRDPKELGRLEEWLWAQYTEVSRVQEEVR